MKLSLPSISAVAVFLASGGSSLHEVAANNAGRAAAVVNPTSRIPKRPQQQRRRWGLSAVIPDVRGGEVASDSDNDENVEYYHDNDKKDANQPISTFPFGSVSVVPGETLPPALSGRSLSAFSNRHVENDATLQHQRTRHCQADQTPSVPLTTSPSIHPPPDPISYLSSLVKGGETTAATDMAMKSAKWISFRNRAITAILMMAFLGFLSYYFKEDGLMVFTLLLQALMYGEMTTVIGGEFTNPLQKWWWFASACVAWNGPKVMPWKGTFFQAISYGMTIASAIGVTLQLNWQKSKAPAFREYIRQAAVVVLSSVLVVLPTSYWIATLEEFGMMWIFVPALYMIINDTMAYAGGQLIGKRALLPSISPKKTWEGFLVAAVSTVGVAWWLGTSNKLVGYELFKKLYPLDKTDGMLLAAFASLMAPFGGFLASIIKRAYGQKDFGALLPGHGGLVDRLDCQILLAPAVYFYLSLHKFRDGQVLG
jgi:CDP-diglyceride synthetase